MPYNVRRHRAVAGHSLKNWFFFSMTFLLVQGRSPAKAQPSGKKGNLQPRKMPGELGGGTVATCG
jgi:hypothetical protein